MSEKEETHLKELNGQLDECLGKIFNANSSSLYVFYVLNHRINFMWWWI